MDVDQKDFAARQVLVTGSAGTIGRSVVRALIARGHGVRGFDRVEHPDLKDQVVADLSDAAAIERAVTGMNAVIHLAATVDDADFLSDILPNNIVGTYHVLDAAAGQGVRRAVLASSIQVLAGLKVEGRPVRVSDGAAPINFYGASKVFGEALAGVYAHRHRMEVLNARIGWLPRNPRGARHLRDRQAADLFLSNDDAARFFTCAVEAVLPPDVRTATFLVFSRTNRYDLEPAKRLLGYEPRDRFPEGLPFSLD